MIQRAYHDTVVLDPSYTYATVLHCDTEMRNLLEEYDLERPEPNETTPMFWARIFSLQNINIRLIRFHRPCKPSLVSLSRCRTDLTSFLVCSRIERLP